MNKKISLALVFGFFIVFTTQSQDVNSVDELGRKQGKWTKKYPNGITMYEGTFKDGKPIGEMKRYFENGTIKAIMVFNESGEYASATLYYENGKKSAEGFFLNNQKDSTWKYFSYYTQDLVSEEFYKNGIKHGLEKVYYPDGTLSEQTRWKNGTREGKWIRFFEDGTKKSEAKYQFDQLNGPYTVFYATGKWLAKGNYMDGKREGPWLFYDENGNVKYQVNYANGIPDNQQEQLEKDQEFYKLIEENLGKYEEPTIEDFIPGGRSY